MPPAKSATPDKQGLQRRRHYRVRYPITVRPLFVSQLGTFEVVELSEGGIKFRFDRDSLEYLNFTIFGEIQFHDGKSVPIQGNIIRLERNRAVAQLTSQIPPKRIRKEELLVIRKRGGEK